MKENKIIRLRRTVLSAVAIIGAGLGLLGIGAVQAEAQNGRHDRDWNRRDAIRQREERVKREQRIARARYLRDKARRDSELRRQRERLEAQRRHDRYAGNHRVHYRNTTSSVWAIQDADHDGIPNGRDRYPNDPLRH